MSLSSGPTTSILLSSTSSATWISSAPTDLGPASSTNIFADLIRSPSYIGLTSTGISSNIKFLHDSRFISYSANFSRYLIHSSSFILGNDASALEWKNLQRVSVLRCGAKCFRVESP